MKQTVDERAEELCKAWGVENNHGYSVKDTFKAGFIQGAKWQAKQSPWISVGERLPETNDNVLLLNKLNRSGKYFVQENSYTNGEWAVKSAMFYTPIAWMPIPSFDEILEANEDILERIKEKGD